jgi:hypothetical protein
VKRKFLFLCEEKVAASGASTSLSARNGTPLDDGKGDINIILYKIKSTHNLPKNKDLIFYSKENRDAGILAEVLFRQ